ncbi:MAG: hypothetical protein FP824_03725 [Euryarchaeota archaeon]|nr:hypothetical protein [Euryarchaeota archaeon]MBU4143310.1 hypothetical protein [Candidatus Thermoplasmatota archaeon]
MKQGKIHFRQIGLENAVFGYSYAFLFRYYKAHMLQRFIENMEEIIPEIEEDKRPSLKRMYEVEVVINTVQYAADLAAIIITLKEDIPNLQKRLMSIHETGSGSILEFYQNIKNRPIDYFIDIFGYTKIDDNKVESLNKSAEKLQAKLNEIAEFYIQYYPFYTSYKHGLRIFPMKNTETNEIMIFEAKKDYTYTIYEYGGKWYSKYLILTQDIYEIFTRIIAKRLQWEIPAKSIGANFESYLSDKPDAESQ